MKAETFSDTLFMSSVSSPLILNIEIIKPEKYEENMNLHD